MNKYFGQLAAGALIAVAGIASADYQTSYTFTVSTGQPVTNVMLLESGDGFGGMTWAFTVSGTGESTLTNPFHWDTEITNTLLIGIVQGLPNDGNPNQKHIVLFMDPVAAQLSNHIAWGTLFRTTLEEQLIADIELATSGQDWPIIQPGLDAVGTFGSGEAMNGILGPGGVSRSAWFATGRPLTVMAFSDGTIVGEGTSEVTYIPDVCEGDIDDDRQVGLIDLAIMLNNFGLEEDATLQNGDLDGDGDVDLIDLAVMLQNYGLTCE